MKRTQKQYLAFTVTTVVFYILGQALMDNSDMAMSDAYEPTAFINQVVTDWNTVPFVKIFVIDEDSCPEGTDLVFERHWLGSRIACY